MAIESYSTFQLRIKLIQVMSTISLTSIPFACLKHGTRSMMISSQRNANKVWGMRDWTTTPPNIEHQVAEITNARGKNGVANSVTRIGQKKFAHNGS